MILVSQSQKEFQFILIWYKALPLLIHTVQQRDNMIERLLIGMYFVYHLDRILHILFFTSNLHFTFLPVRHLANGSIIRLRTS